MKRFLLSLITILFVCFVAAASTSFPSASLTSWMTPEAFHLRLGMKRAAAMESLSANGFKTTPGKASGHVVVEYGAERSVTLAFENDRLKSLRFELVSFAPKVKSAFNEQRDELLKSRGEPRKPSSPTVLLYDDQIPQIQVVLSIDPTTEYGKQGLGFLVVRYFVPVAEAAAAPTDAPRTASNPR